MATAQPCTIDWIVIPAPDIAKARSFYGEIFGFTPGPPSDSFQLFQTGTVHGAFVADRPVAEGGILFSITVDDLDTTIAAIIENGGELLREPRSIAPGAGSFAGFRDPNGNEIEIYAAEKNA